MTQKKGFKDAMFLPKGQILIRQGAPADYAYLVQSGRLSIYTESIEKTVELAQLGPGQIIGEMALINRAPRAASVKALEDSNLIVITPDVFQGKLDKSDPTVKAIMRMLIKRIEDSNSVKTQNQQAQNENGDAARVIRRAYDRMYEELPENRQDDFETEVSPKLVELLEAMTQFQGKQ